MNALIETIRAYGTASGIVAASVLMFLGSLVLAWLFIVKIPADYLINEHPKVKTFRSNHPIAGAVLRVCKNGLGVVFAVAGFIMLFIPGQGLLFIFLGLTLMDFPGKKPMIRRMLGWRNTLQVINRIRSRANQPPLEVPAHAEQADGA